jgi:hypothetical protein
MIYSRNASEIKKFSGRLVPGSLSGVLSYNQYYVLFRNFNSKRVNNDRLCVLLDEYFSNTISAVNCGELLAYLGRVNPDSISGILDESLRNKAGGPIFDDMSAKTVFERIKTDPRFKSKGRRVIMA